MFSKGSVGAVTKSCQQRIKYTNISKFNKKLHKNLNINIGFIYNIKIDLAKTINRFYYVLIISTINELID